MDIAELNDVIVRAKAATYAGGGVASRPSRPGSRDLVWSEGDWRYHDSYFGGTDFLGQEMLWLRGEPVWAMNYYGYIERPDLIDAQRPARLSRRPCRPCTARAVFSAVSNGQANSAAMSMSVGVMPGISTAANRSWRRTQPPMHSTILAAW